VLAEGSGGDTDHHGNDGQERPGPRGRGIASAGATRTFILGAIFQIAPRLAIAVVSRSQGQAFCRPGPRMLLRSRGSERHRTPRPTPNHHGVSLTSLCFGMGR
jgi:hypothetical protein